GPVHVAFHALHRVARIDGVDQREALRLLAHALRPRFEALRALLDADLAPLLEALRRRLDGKVDVLRIRVRHVAELRACRWTDRGKAAAARRLDPAPAVVEAARLVPEIRFFDFHGCAHGTIAARSTLRSAASFIACPTCSSLYLPSTRSWNGKRLRFATTKSSAWIRCRG